MLFQSRTKSRKGQPSSPAPNSKAKTDGEGEKPSKDSGNRDESPGQKEYPVRVRSGTLELSRNDWPWMLATDTCLWDRPWSFLWQALTFFRRNFCDCGCCRSEQRPTNILLTVRI